jgi:hypothetical protein
MNPIACAVLGVAEGSGSRAPEAFDREEALLEARVDSLLEIPGQPRFFRAAIARRQQQRAREENPQEDCCQPVAPHGTH